MNFPEPEALLRQLIEIPSISGEEEAVGNFLQTLLGHLGFHVQTQEVFPGRNNLLATRPGHEPQILLCSHIDTVPPHIPFRETKDLIYGRGACDTKGVITSMLHAGKSLLAEGFQDFGYLFLVGEEVDHCGAIEARKLGLSPIACIVGEPTECKLATGQKGIYKASLHTTGIAGHSAYPESGHSAIPPLIEALSRLQNYEWPEDEILGKTSLNIGTLQGGVAANVFAPKADATILLRLTGPLEDAEKIVEQQVGPDIEIKKISGNDPAHLVTFPGYEGEAVAFNTDIPYLGFERNLLYGPGSIKVAHSAGEFIPKTELHAAITTYSDLVKTSQESF